MLVSSLCLSFGFLAQTAPPPKAVVYLEREVPLWSRQNQCFSCHNNGDAARALIRAGRTAALRETLAFLGAPDRWQLNRGHPASSDRKLARAQFTVALSEAVGAGLLPQAALRGAAVSLVADQDADGAWRSESGELQIGSPVTWGTPLLTLLAAQATERGGEAAAAARARRWLANFAPKSQLEVAVAILAGREGFTARLGRGQNADGGWGAYPQSPSEVFDTALAVLALQGPAADRGRAYLLRTQLPDGGWPETTRPSGGQSYAQHISTSAWAAIALLGRR